jgi:hypothetical protein
MAGYIGKIETFDFNIENWTSYTERLEQYFEVNEIVNEKRVSALLSLIGGKTYTLLRNLTTPDKPKDKSSADIVKILLITISFEFVPFLIHRLVCPLMCHLSRESYNIRTTFESVLHIHLLIHFPSDLPWKLQQKMQCQWSYKESSMNQQYIK